ncbi:MAG: hypothetical protein ACOY9D_06850 [Pseudomonadota bacterium]
MKLSRTDLPILRWSILATCSSVLVSAVILYLSSTYVGNSQRDLLNARNARNDARMRLAAAREDSENMSIYSSEYGALVKRKIIGDDQRLDWIEGMEMLRQMNLAWDFRYHIAPQKIYAPKSPISGGNFDIHYSEMGLQFDLLHEAQLANFFTALPKHIQGWYQLEGCTLRRDATTEVNAAMSSGAQLSAECTGGWITLKNRNAPS